MLKITFVMDESEIDLDTLRLTVDHNDPDKVGKSRELVPAEEPFIIMDSSGWNDFQKLMDECGMREKFQALKHTIMIVPRGHVHITKPKAR